jgi:actin-related protein 9
MRLNLLQIHPLTVHGQIIAPGSKHTNVQLGLPESFTPPQRRFATRMFPGLKPGEWEPIKIETKTKVKHEDHQGATLPSASAQTASEAVAVNGTSTSGDFSAPLAATASTEPAMSTAPTDVEMADAPAQSAPTEGTADTNPQTQQSSQPPADDQPPLVEPEPELEFEDDPYSEEGAVYPLVEGRIENWSCFFALLSHIWKTMSPHFVSPLLVVSQPCWTERDKEMITQYFFENHRIPAFCMMDSALAACYAYGVPSGLVVDVGFEKCDVSAVTDYQVNDAGRAVALRGCGGRAMTTRLQQLLSNEGIECDENMAEQLKRSYICEILPAGTPLPVGGNITNGSTSNPAAEASTGAVESGTNAKDLDGANSGGIPRGPGEGTQGGDENGDEENEGVLDVASIVAQSNTAEILAKREAERQAKLAAKKSNPAEAPKPVRLRNAEREKAAFVYEETMPLGASSEATSRKRKREVEVGVERFMAATPATGQTDGILDNITAAIHSTVLGVPDVSQRSGLWDNLIVLGNGSRVRGRPMSLL